MEILVRKPTDLEAAAMMSKPVWTCGVSEFVVFPKGLSCVWQAKKAVKKYYEFT